MALKKEDILEAISKMSVMDIVDLISAMEEKFGVSAAVPVAAASEISSAEKGADDSGDDGGTADLFLVDVGDKKVDISFENVPWDKALQAILETNSLAMEEKFGVSAAAPVAVATATAAAGEAESPEEAEAAKGDLHLAEVGDKKVEVIKAVRSITGLGLKDAKGLVDEAPSSIKEGISKAEAKEFVKQLEEVGAKAELK